MRIYLRDDYLLYIWIDQVVYVFVQICNFVLRSVETAAVAPFCLTVFGG